MERFLRGFCRKVKQFSLGDGDGWIPASPTPSTLDPILFLCDLWQLLHIIFRGFPGGSEDRESSANVRDPGSISGSGRFPGGKHGTPLQCSCQENPRDRAAQRAIVHGVTKSWLPGESQGQSSPEGYSPRSHKELDTTEVTEHT